MTVASRGAIRGGDRGIARSPMMAPRRVAAAAPCCGRDAGHARAPGSPARSTAAGAGPAHPGMRGAAAHGASLPSTHGLCRRRRPGGSPWALCTMVFPKEAPGVGCDNMHGPPPERAGSLQGMPRPAADHAKSPNRDWDEASSAPQSLSSRNSLRFFSRNTSLIL